MFGPRITRADGKGRMPWSPTVAHVTRMKDRRRSSKMTLLAIIVILSMMGCLLFWGYGQLSRPPKKAAKKPLTATVLPPTTTYHTYTYPDLQVTYSGNVIITVATSQP